MKIIQNYLTSNQKFSVNPELINKLELSNLCSINILNNYKQSYWEVLELITL